MQGRLEPARNSRAETHPLAVIMAARAARATATTARARLPASSASCRSMRACSAPGRWPRLRYGLRPIILVPPSGHGDMELPAFVPQVLVTSYDFTSVDRRENIQYCVNSLLQLVSALGGFWQVALFLAECLCMCCAHMCV